MKLKEIFDQLTYGELSQISFGGGEAGAIQEADWPRLIPHVNLGLTTLFTRFPLKENRVRIVPVTGQTDYRLHSQYSLVSTYPISEEKFIDDTVQRRFMNDVLKIKRVYTDDDFELSVNDLADPYSLFTPSASVLRLPEDMVTDGADLPDDYVTDGLTIVYQANHVPVSLAQMAIPSSIEVDLPPTHLEALLYFIASRVHNPVGMSNEFHTGNNYAAKFEAACQKLENSHMRVEQDSQNTRFRAKGWV